MYMCNYIHTYVCTYIYVYIYIYIYIERERCICYNVCVYRYVCIYIYIYIYIFIYNHNIVRALAPKRHGPDLREAAATTAYEAGRWLFMCI